MQEGITIDWMSNVERFSVEQDIVRLLLNKHQRHRGDTLNSRTELHLGIYNYGGIEMLMILQQRYLQKSLPRLKGLLGSSWFTGMYTKCEKIPQKFC